MLLIGGLIEKFIFVNITLSAERFSSSAVITRVNLILTRRKLKSALRGKTVLLMMSCDSEVFGWGLSHFLHSDGICVHVCFGDFASLSFNNHHSISPRNKVYFYQSIRPTVFIYVIVMFFGSSAL